MQVTRFLIIGLFSLGVVALLWFDGIGDLLPYIGDFWQALPALAFVSLWLFLEWKGRR